MPLPIAETFELLFEKNNRFEAFQFYMRKWLSGRASPCQGEGREFESRLPLQRKQALKVLLFSLAKNVCSEVLIGRVV